MVSDAISLAVLCPREPAPGTVTELQAGTLVREDALDLSDAPDPSPEADGADPA